MGCITIDGVMYSLRPYVRGALSRTPYPPSVEDVDYDNGTYKLIPLELQLTFDDEQPHNHTGMFYYTLQTNWLASTVNTFNEKFSKADRPAR